MGISRSQFIEKVKRRLGHPLVKVELCDEQIVDHIDYARQKYLKWAVGNATQEVYFTLLLQAGNRLYDLPAGVTEVVSYDDTAIKSGGINTLFTIDNYMFMNGYYGNAFFGGYDMVSYHLVLDFLTTLSKYRTSPYNWKYHSSTNQLEINPTPKYEGNAKPVEIISPETGLLTTYYFDSPGYVLLRAYMVSGSTLPNYRPDWNDILKEQKNVIERKQLNEEDIENKYVLLNHDPFMNDNRDSNIPYDMSMTVDGVVTTKYEDWVLNRINKRIVQWEGLALEDTLVAGDILEISYPVIFESNYYPDEWTEVTATSTEVEQHVMTQTDIDMGFVRLQYKVWGDNVKVSVDGTVQELGANYSVNAEDTTIIQWKSLGMDGVLEVEDELVVEYVTVRSYRPSYEERSQSINRIYTTRIENRIITLDEFTNKQLVLEEVASISSNIKLTTSGTSRLYGIDFAVSGNVLYWSGLGLDGVIAENDPITITYTSAVPFEREVEEPFYDNDWMLDYVTAMSKITLGHIRRKFASFSSLGNQGISLDGDALISDGQQEKEYLETTLRDEEAYEGYGIEIGMM